MHQLTFANTAGICSHCSRAAFWNCTCGEQLCPRHRVAHAQPEADQMAIVIPPQTPTQEAQRLLERINEPQYCTRCRRRIGPNESVWAMFPGGGGEEIIYCDACAGLKSASGRTYGEEVPLVRGGCGHCDITVGDLVDETNLSDLLIWLGLAAAVVGLAMILSVWL